jgi:catechol 2,3-dioxygenase-like lactoylglutathione lyase family enzyme
VNASLDALFVACGDDLDAACRPYERLGLALTPPSAERRMLLVGLGPQAFRFHFLANDPGPPRSGPELAVGAYAVGLRVPDLSAAVADLAGRGLPARPYRAATGEPLARAPLRDRAGIDLVLREQGPEIAGAPDHAFPLRRLDHLAAVAHDLDAKCAFWADVLGVPVGGEVRTPTLIIRQLRLGDAVLELLGAASADSPIHQRPAGLVSMASWEVPDLDRAVALARQAGFSPSEPAPGALPGTRISTIPGDELAGVNMQLLQYV